MECITPGESDAAALTARLQKWGRSKIRDASADLEVTVTIGCFDAAGSTALVDAGEAGRWWVVRAEPQDVTVFAALEEVPIGERGRGITADRLDLIGHADLDGCRTVVCPSSTRA